jgi:hypothetical protein
MLSRCSLPLTLLLVAVAGMAACSSEQGAAPVPAETVDPPAPPAPPPVEEDAGPDVEAPVAFTPSFPKVLNRGGKTIATPKIVPILFKGDPLATQIDDFTKKLAGSEYWKGVATEYGVGAITASDAVVLDEVPPTTTSSTEIESWLSTKLTTTNELGTADPSTLYAIFYPDGVSITLDGAGPEGQSCQGYGGYHFEVTAGAANVGYAVLPRCADIDELTVATSHEYFEWATDPFPESAPAFQRLDDQHWAWQAVMIGELSDLCTFLDRDNLRPTELGYLVQRHWSNKASLAGQYPCAPQKPTYVQAIPNATDDVLVPDYFDQTKYVTTQAIRVAPGESKSVDVLVYSDKPSSQMIPLRAITYDELYGTGSSTGFELSLASSHVTAGGTTKLTVRAPKSINYDIAILVAYVDANNVHYWPVIVTNDDASSVAAGRPTITPTTMPGRRFDLRETMRRARAYVRSTSWAVPAPR